MVERPVLIISIHAPVKGATSRQDRGVELIQISIHAPVKGATVVRAADEEEALISIHTPVKGATLEHHTRSTP